jgi:hypothetical protein
MKYGIYIDGDLASHVATPDSLVIDGNTFQARFPGLMQINQDYRDFLWTSIPAEREWTSTARFMDYIAMDVIEFCLQKLEGGGEKDNWRLYLWFSGCGGTSEVSSMLGAHWADLWYTRRRIDVHANLFVPQGFLPHDDQPTFEWPQFVAIPGYSYASFHPSGEC